MKTLLHYGNLEIKPDQDKNFPSDKDSLIGQISVDLIRTPQFDKGLGSLLF